MTDWMKNLAILGFVSLATNTNEVEAIQLSQQEHGLFDMVANVYAQKEIDQDKAFKENQKRL